jgi:hypothetical protein
MNTAPPSDAETSTQHLRPARSASRLALPAPPPVLAWALVLMAAMLCYFVHLVNGQVTRGERLQMVQRASAASMPTRAR